MVDGRQLGAALVTVGGAVTAVATFLPWLHSGSRARSSYALARIVDRLGFSPGGWADGSLRLWPLVPLLIAVVVISAWVSVLRPTVWPAAAVATACATGWIAGTAVAVLRAPDISLFRVGAGIWVALAGAFTMVAGAAVVAFSCRAARSSEAA